MATTKLPVLGFRSQAAWASWLDKNHETAVGVWLKLARKASGVASISHDEAVEAALCYGWIDGQAETRARRIATFVQMLEDGKKLYP